MGSAQVVAVPRQGPDQPANTEPACGVAVSVTGVPAATVALQVAVQLTEPGVPLTLPAPSPVTVMNTLGPVLATYAVSVWHGTGETPM